MRNIFLFLLLIVAPSIQAQVLCSAIGEAGSGYPAFTTAGFGIENPDCVHGDFGPHITQVFDETLNRNVFLFHSHIDADNDRCLKDDRVRMEVKGGPNTNEELIHPNGTTAYYRWKFQISEDYTGGSSFHHIFQLKAKEGDDGIPILTITLRTQKLEVRHSGGDSGADLGKLIEEDLDLFRGKWVEVYVKLVQGESGLFEISLKDLLTGQELLAYSNDNIDLWRLGAAYNRPKWGMYRAKSDGLVDEAFRFADFCISEEAVSLCPAEAPLLVDETPPTPPTNLIANNIMISSADLSWTAASDEFGINAYQVYQDGNQVWEGKETSTDLTNLTGSTTYNFYVIATDDAGNVSAQSNEIIVTTDEATALPGMATSPFPTDGAMLSPNNVTLTWETGENTETTKIYFGTNSSPTSFMEVTDNTFIPTLSENTQYFWQVIHSNINGETSSPIWTFTTTSLMADAPWVVFRGNDRIDKETDFLKGLDIPNMPTLDEVSADPNGSNNQFYNFRHSEEEKFRWRQDFNATDTAITVVARIKALGTDPSTITFFEIKAFGWREKLRMNQKTIKLERSVPVVEEDIPFAFKEAFHLIRVTMQGNIMKVYLDENPISIAVGNSTDDDSSSRFEFGKSGSQDCGASIDWITVLNNAAYPPGEGPALPSDLFLSSDATLSDIQINGESIAEFSPNVLAYTIDIVDTTKVPIIQATTSSNLANVQVTNPTSLLNSSTIITVTAQDGFTQNTYTINYSGIVSIEETLSNAGITIFPNPTKGNINILSKKTPIESVIIYNQSGKVVYENQKGNLEFLNIPSLSHGLYILLLKNQEEQYFKKKIIVE
ncbi:MAG: T9SS type A sorting domain-containing protein [Saprospiraceae bacterium]